MGRASVQRWNERMALCVENSPSGASRSIGRSKLQLSVCHDICRVLWLWAESVDRMIMLHRHAIISALSLLAEKYRSRDGSRMNNPSSPELNNNMIFISNPESS